MENKSHVKDLLELINVVGLATEARHQCKFHNDEKSCKQFKIFEQRFKVAEKKLR